MLLIATFYDVCILRKRKTEVITFKNKTPNGLSNGVSNGGYITNETEMKDIGKNEAADYANVEKVVEYKPYVPSKCYHTCNDQLE